MKKIVMPLIAVVLAACGPAKPTETVDELVANPARAAQLGTQARRDAAQLTWTSHARALAEFVARRQAEKGRRFRTGGGAP